MNKIYAIIFSVLIIVLGLTATASAGVLDDDDSVVIEKHHFFDDWSNSIFNGYVIDGNAKAYIENKLMLEPEGESLFGISFKIGEWTLTSFDGKNMVDEVLLIGEIGQSDTFYLSYLKMDEPYDLNAGGVLYNVTQHWDDNLPPVLIGVYLMESGNFLYTLRGKYYLSEIFGEATNGYSVSADMKIGMESFNNPDFRDFKFAFRKDETPDGSVYWEVFLDNIAGATYTGGGVGFSF